MSRVRFRCGRSSKQETRAFGARGHTYGHGHVQFDEGKAQERRERGTINTWDGGSRPFCNATIQLRQRYGNPK